MEKAKPGHSRKTKPKSGRKALSTPEAARHVGVSEKWLENDRRKVLHGEPGNGPPFRRVGAHWRYDVPQLDAWKEANTFDPQNPPKRQRKRLQVEPV
jgi:hypothetical protein